MTVKSILGEVGDELYRSVKLYGEFNSLHEAYAILLEEVDELWEVVRMKTNGQQRERNQSARKESIQIAAMAAKIVHWIDEK